MTPLSPLDLQSDESGSTLPVSGSEDGASISSASCFQTQFTIPSSWPPVIQVCIDHETDEARKSKLVPTVRSEICRVLANAMFCYNPNPNKELCTRVAKLLVKKYKFMADVGRGVTGYVSHSDIVFNYCMHTIELHYIIICVHWLQHLYSHSQFAYPALWCNLCTLLMQGSDLSHAIANLFLCIGFMGKEVNR